MEENKKEKASFSRRTLIKALAGIPILGLFSYEAFKKISFDKEKRTRVIKELGLGDLKAPRIVSVSSGGEKDLLRIGFIGFGNRAGQLSNSLGFIPKL